MLGHRRQPMACPSAPAPKTVKFRNMANSRQGCEPRSGISGRIRSRAVDDQLHPVCSIIGRLIPESTRRWSFVIALQHRCCKSASSSRQPVPEAFKAGCAASSLPVSRRTPPEIKPLEYRKLEIKATRFEPKHKCLYAVKWFLGAEDSPTWASAYFSHRATLEDSLFAAPESLHALQNVVPRGARVGGSAFIRSKPVRRNVTEFT